MLVPLRPVQLTTAQRDAIIPEEGMGIYNTTTKQNEVYNGTEWKGIGNLSITELSDVSSTLGSPGDLFVTNSSGDGLEPINIKEVVSNTYLGSKTYQHAIGLGATHYWPLDEGIYPFRSATDDNDLIRYTSTTPVDGFTASGSIIVNEVLSGSSTNFTARQDVFISSPVELITSNEDFTLSVTINVPSTELVSDFNDRTIIFLGVVGELVIRNGQLAYKQTSQEYHPGTLTADTSHHISLTRKVSDGSMSLWLDGVKFDLVSHTNVNPIINMSLFSNGFTNFLEGKVEDLSVWNRLLSDIEVEDHYRIRENLVLNANTEKTVNFGALEDTVAYSLADRNKSVTVNDNGTGLEYVEHLKKAAIIEDGLRGYLAGSVPANAVVAFQIQNKNLTLPVNAPKSKIHALTAPVANISFDIIKRALGAYETDIIIGTITFVTGSNVGTVTIASQTTFIPGDVLCIKSPALAEGCKDLFINLVGFSPLPLYT